MDRTFALCLVVALMFALQWRTLRSANLVSRSVRRDLYPGDIVLYVNPGKDDNYNNMITQVLSVFPEHGTVLIRGRCDGLKGSTTAVVSRKNLHYLPVDEHHPIRVPGEPTPSNFDQFGFTTTNGATWIEIPLNWFPYEIVNTKREENLKKHLEEIEKMRKDGWFQEDPAPASE